MKVCENRLLSASKVQVGKTTLLDLTMSQSSTPQPAPSSSHPPSTSPASVLSHLPSAFGVYIAQTGNISEGASSTGSIYRELGEIQLRKKDGYGDLFTEVQDLEISSIIGRAMVVAPLLSSDAADPATKQKALKMGPGILAGVIARSAGAWSERLELLVVRRADLFAQQTTRPSALAAARQCGRKQRRVDYDSSQQSVLDVQDVIGRHKCDLPGDQDVARKGVGHNVSLHGPISPFGAWGRTKTTSLLMLSVVLISHALRPVRPAPISSQPLVL